MPSPGSDLRMAASLGLGVSSSSSGETAVSSARVIRSSRLSASASWRQTVSSTGRRSPMCSTAAFTASGETAIGSARS